MFQIVLIAAAAISFVFSEDFSVPPFLIGAPESTLQEFHQLLNQSKKWTDIQTNIKIHEWVAKQSSEIKTKYETFKEERKKVEADAEAAHQASISRFSKEAKEADVKLTAISKDPFLNAEQKHEQIQKLVNALPAQVKKEIETEMQG